MNFKPTEYELVSVASGTRRSDEGGWTLGFTDEPPSLIRADYANKQLTIRENLGGMYQFADWLPIRRILEGSSAPVTYKSSGMADSLGLNNLWITFNGWWPDKGAGMVTGSFKECEAYSVCARMEDSFDKVLVVASAGNTARAFARVCSDNNIPLLLFVPRDNLNAIEFGTPIKSCVKMICAETGGDYFDAIRMSNTAVAGSDLFVAEGGAKNIARRDGMATTVLSAVTEIGHIPDAYFQAVGSGTGAISAWEAAMRFEADGRFGENNMKLMVSQNVPFTPMLESHEADSREFLIPDDVTARSYVNEVNAKVLTNRRPPWGVPGGLYDALKASGGSVLTATNEEAQTAGERFEQSEGIDISDAASVAVASLFKAVEDGSVGKDDTIMLNITGGGTKLYKETHEMHILEPSVILPVEASDDEIVEAAVELFG
ncbi:MAG: cysteate synthase [Spirochaetaceae bacterium]|nr:cysteate synthase [Spirochaetaceae bacterium]